MAKSQGSSFRLLEKSEHASLTEEGYLARGGYDQCQRVRDVRDGCGGGMTRAETSGKLYFVCPGLYHAAGGFDYAVSANDESPVDVRQFLDGLVHEWVENVPVFFVVSVERVENKRLYSFFYGFVISQNE